MSRPLLNFETFGAAGAIVVSVAALYVAWDQAVVMRQEQHASAWPYIYIETNYNGDEDFNYLEVTMTNPGVGPAMVRSAVLSVDGQPIANWWDLVDRTFPENMHETAQLGQAESALGVVGVGEQRQIIRVNFPITEQGSIDFSNYLQLAVSGDIPRLELDVCYCSVYGRCWIGNSDPDNLGQDHEHVASCESSRDFLSTFLVATPEQIEAAGRGELAGAGTAEEQMGDTAPQAEETTDTSTDASK